MHDAVPVFVINPNNFDWLTFLLGGALGSFIGALIILVLERLLNQMWERNQRLEEKKKICQALIIEVEKNILICEEAVETFTQNRLGIEAIGEFKFIWLETYSEKYANFLSDESRALYALIRDSKSYARQISKFEDNVFILSAISSAMEKYPGQIQNRNDTIVVLAKELKVTFEKIKSSPLLVVS